MARNCVIVLTSGVTITLGVALKAPPHEDRACIQA